ncbi:hypothetical protein BDY21DRAFT_410394 [Lineolata rhizophorae]|uniref:Uncharacterized protein n=1 Tax=Lineolata rhizophorae TaxID=578093 RepID=A0A6A6P395_9PEZI|nr:hypothetical protein BDY21DRAFT_410394 [Lineolata rhizophorae]
MESPGLSGGRQPSPSNSGISRRIAARESLEHSVVELEPRLSNDRRLLFMIIRVFMLILPAIVNAFHAPDELSLLEAGLSTDSVAQPASQPQGTQTAMPPSTHSRTRSSAPPAEASPPVEVPKLPRAMFLGRGQSQPPASSGMMGVFNVETMEPSGGRKRVRSPRTKERTKRARHHGVCDECRRRKKQAGSPNPTAISMNLGDPSPVDPMEVEIWSTEDQSAPGTIPQSSPGFEQEFIFNDQLAPLPPWGPADHASDNPLEFGRRVDEQPLPDPGPSHVPWSPPLKDSSVKGAPFDLSLPQLSAGPSSPASVLYSQPPSPWQNLLRLRQGSSHKGVTPAGTPYVIDPREPGSVSGPNSLGSGAPLSSGTRLSPRPCSLLRRNSAPLVFSSLDQWQPLETVPENPNSIPDEDEPETGAAEASELVAQDIFELDGLDGFGSDDSLMLAELFNYPGNQHIGSQP